MQKGVTDFRKDVLAVYGTDLTSTTVLKGYGMDDKLPLLYHQATLDLLHEHSSISEDAVEILDWLQEERNLKLPASVREWYSLSQAVAWLSKYSNQDHPIPLEQLAGVDDDWEDIQCHEIDLVPIMIENQNACTWALQLNGTEDPPMVVSFDKTAPSAKWEPYAERFSTFVYTQIWDYQGVFSDYTLWGGALLSPDELYFLRTHFTEEPQTFTHPTPVTYRFSRGTQRILLWCGGEQMAQWFLSAATEEEWSQLTQTVESCETLAQSLPNFIPFDQ